MSDVLPEVEIANLKAEIARMEASADRGFHENAAKASAAQNAFWGALAKAQGAMTHASKDRTNPHFKQTYATLASVIEAVREPLSSNDIARIQPPAIIDGGVITVETRLVHKDGGFAFCVLKSQPKDTLSPQVLGSAITYLRRYGLMAMCGIAPDDDDAEEAHGRGGQRREDRFEDRREEPRREDHREAPRNDDPHPDQASPESLLADAGITIPMFDAWRQSRNFPTWANMDEGSRTLLARKLSQPGDAARKLFDEFLTSYRSGDSKTVPPTDQNAASAKQSEPEHLLPNGHHQQFTEKVRKRLNVELGKLPQPLKYEDYARFHEAHGRGRPSTWNEQRQWEMFAHCRDGGWEEIVEWLSKNPKEGA